MNGQANRHGTQWKAIAHFRRCCRTTHNLGTDLQTARRNNISLLTVSVLQKRQASGAARIIFYGGDGRFNPMLLAFEINQAKFLLVTPADTASCYTAIMVTPASALANLDQALLGLGLCNIAVVRIRDISRRGRQRSECLYWHKCNQ